MFIDTHCHLDKKSYPDLEQVIKNMDNNIIIASGYNDETNLEIIELVKKYKNVYGTLGLHPEEVKNITENSLKIIEDNINNDKIVAVGEIGLDYYWEQDNKEKQQRILIEQINIARKYNKPIVIHSREAAIDTYNILREHAKGLKGVMHCYSYDLKQAKEFIDLGFKLGIGGIITFKNSETLTEVVKNIPLEDLLLETDSPFLAPVPYRGKTNEPSNTLLIAKKIAEIKSISLEQVLEITTKTSISQFDLPLKI